MQSNPDQGFPPSLMPNSSWHTGPHVVESPIDSTTLQRMAMLHPQNRALLDLIELRGIPPTHTLSPADARAFYRERRHITQPAPPEVALVRDLLMNGPHGPIPMRLYRPLGADAAAVLPVLVYYHGGGWVIGDLDTHDTLCR